MKPAQKARARLAELYQACQKVSDSMNTYLPKLDAKLVASLDAIKDFHSSFEMQLNTILEAEQLSNLRAQKLQAAVQQVQFWNHLKEGIIERQKRENLEIARVAEAVSQGNEFVQETQRAVETEALRAREEEEEARKGKFKNVTNKMAQSETQFNSQEKTIRLTLQRSKEAVSIELRFIPEKHKYVVSGQCHPKVAALVSHFNFHKDLQRLRKELRELLAVL